MYCAHLAFNEFLFSFQNIPTYGKHRAKQELETVPPRKLEIAPLLGGKSDPKSGTETHSPVVQFLIIDLLAAAVKVFKKCSIISNSPKGQKSGTENNSLAYTYMLWCYYLGQVWPFEVLLSGPSLFFTKHCLSKTL